MVYFALQMQSSLLINCNDSEKETGKRTDKPKQSKGSKKEKKKDQAEGKRHE